MSAIGTGRFYPKGIFLVNQPQGYSADGRIMSMKNSNDTIGNRTHDLRLVAQCPNQLRHRAPHIYIIITIIIIGTTAPFEPGPSSEASASCPYSLQHSSNFSPPTSWHLPSHHVPILVLACPFVFFLLPLQRELVGLFPSIRIT